MADSHRGHERFEDSAWLWSDARVRNDRCSALSLNELATFIFRSYEPLITRRYAAPGRVISLVPFCAQGGIRSSGKPAASLWQNTLAMRMCFLGRFRTS